MAPREREAPPVGEQIHLPAPSIIPVLNAVGLSLTIVMVTLSIIGVIVGLTLFFVTTAIWIRDVRRDIADLPAEHH